MEGSREEAWGGGARLKVLALGASCALFKKAKKIGLPVMEEAEGPHEPSPDHHWSESFYFNFTDPKRAMGGWTRIGMLPNQDSDTGAMMLYAGGSRILATMQGGRTACDGEGLSLGELAYRRLEPLRRWRLEFQGDMLDIENSRRLPELKPELLPMQRVEVELEFEGMAPCFDFKDFDPRAMGEMLVKAGTRLRDLKQVSRISGEHYEQAGRVSGTLKIGNREISFEGGGHRDHSWGIRDWAAPRLWTWLSCRFGEELAFNLSRVAMASVDMFNGFVARDGVNHPLRRAALRTEFEDDGVTQRGLALRIEDTGGMKIEASGDVLTVIPLHLGSDDHVTLVNEALAEYRWGDRVGYGIAEYLHQLE